MVIIDNAECLGLEDDFRTIENGKIALSVCIALGIYSISSMLFSKEVLVRSNAALDAFDGKQSGLVKAV
jgi:hypothetical protein